MTSTSIDRLTGLNASAAIKVPALVATTGPITLSGLQTIDTVALAADDRVLVKDQADDRLNGIYTVSTGIWNRVPDFDDNRDVRTGTIVVVTGGAVGAKQWQVTSANPIVIGTTSIVFAAFVVLASQIIDEDDMASNSATKVPTQQSVKAYVDTGPSTAVLQATMRNQLDVPTYVANLTALRALDTTKDTVAYLVDSSREGIFAWRTGDYSAQITADTASGIYVKANAIASTAGAWVRALCNVITPDMFGGVGDGVTDDGVALNAMFAVVRAEAATANGVASNQVATTIDLSGGRWRTTISINVTGIVGWNFTVRGGLVIGSCTGKAVVDLVGSRGYQFIGVGIYGDPSAKPSAGFQAARPTAAGFCDNASFYDCSTSGYFTRAAFHDYGQETTLHVHPTYFNSQHDARVAIFAGYDSDPFTSDYSTVMTGATSHINNKIINGDFRYLPAGTNIAAVTGVTNAASAVISAPSHPFANGDEVVFASIGGMPGMSAAVGTVSAAAANSFTVNINSTALGSYTSGGFVIRRATKSPILFSRGRQFHFDCSYIVSYGRPGLEITWPDASFIIYDQIVLDILFEGAGCASNVLLSPVANAATIAGFTLKTYQSNAYTSVISVVDAGTVGLLNPLIECTEPITFNVPLGASAGKLGLFGARILYPGAANIVLTAYATGSHGVVIDFNTGKITEITSDPVDQNYTPTCASGTGTVTTFGTRVGTVRGGLGKMTWLELDIPITTNGTGATSITATLPAGITPVRDAFILGRENIISGKSVVGLCVAASGTVTIFNYDNTYPGATGARIKLSGWFERT